MPNAYIDLQTLKSTGGLNLGTGTIYDGRLRQLTEAISREIDRYTNRVFYYYITNKEFNGNGKNELLIPDLVSIGTLLEDTNYDGTFETGWATADYILYPRNAEPTKADFGRPYTSIRVSDKTGGTQDFFQAGLSNYRITGTWGYWKVSHASGANGTLADSTSTALVLSASATGTIEKGMTLLIDDELLYVTNTTATTAHVQRGVNGSTATIHTNIAVSIFDFPGPVQEACFIQSARVWRRKDSGFASAIGMPDTGMMMTWRGSLDPDVKMLLGGYRKLVI